LKRLDNGIDAPGLDVVVEFGLETLDPVLLFRNGADILLEDNLLSGRGTDHFRQPA
jgi:hypothetical protein